MNKITKFPQLVIAEATMLKKHATSEEKSRLDFDSFDPKRPQYCIYGQLTGHCFSSRASELIEKCAKRVYIAEDELTPGECKKLNGKPKQSDRDLTHNEFWSPIEVFIQRAPEWMNEQLINFIQGNVSKLITK